MKQKWYRYMMNEIKKKIGIKKLEITGTGRFLVNRVIPGKKEGKTFKDGPAVNPEGKSIKDIPRAKCMGCGLCFSVCSFNAIEMTTDESSFVPVLDEETCTQCGKCFRSCPGINVLDYPGRLGEVQHMYVTHAKDPDIRHASSSGGTCRSILTALLEKKIVDRVIITRATEDPYRPETIITSSVEDLSGDRLNSIYSPTSPLCSLKDLDRGLKYAFVGLPCHVAGISLSKALRKSIYLTIGIFCSHTPGFEFLNAFLGDLPQKEDIQRLSFRGRGWPGKSTIYYSSGKPHGIWFPAMWNMYNEKKKYQLARCSTCTYYSAEFADISIGDPWSLVREDRNGSSLVFARTERGMNAMQEAAYLVSMQEIEDDRRADILRFHNESAASKQMNG